MRTSVSSRWLVPSSSDVGERRDERQAQPEARAVGPGQDAATLVADDDRQRAVGEPSADPMRALAIGVGVDDDVGARLGHGELDVGQRRDRARRARRRIRRSACRITATFSARAGRVNSKSGVSGSWWRSDRGIPAPRVSSAGICPPGRRPIRRFARRRAKRRQHRRCRSQVGPLPPSGRLRSHVEPPGGRLDAWGRSSHRAGAGSGGFRDATIGGRLSTRGDRMPPGEAAKRRAGCARSSGLRADEGLVRGRRCGPGPAAAVCDHVRLSNLRCACYSAASSEAWRPGAEGDREALQALCPRAATGHLMTISALPQADGLYDPRYEHDACGVAHGGPAGQPADARGRRPRAHRARQPRAPRRRGRRHPHRRRRGHPRRRCPTRSCARSSTSSCRRSGSYGVGDVLPAAATRARAREIEQLLERNVARRGPARRSAGATCRSTRTTSATRPTRRARTSASCSSAAGPGFAGDQDAFERKLYVIRRIVELAAGPDFYASRASPRARCVYKGMLISRQLPALLPRPARTSASSAALALVHSRFSTNTFPSWELAHPYRVIAHNGEINTLRGNINWMRARESQLPPSCSATTCRRSCRSCARAARTRRRSTTSSSC